MIRMGAMFQVACLSLCLALPAAAQEQAEAPLARSLVGSYRKLMEIEEKILVAAKRHDVSPLLARALCLYESGGNGSLTSHAGAQGYFQVMPATFRRMGVRTNIEAGIKYLGLQLRRFQREDLALAAYNGGPGVVTRGRAPLETLQYVLGVGTNKNVLRQHEPRLRDRAMQLRMLRTTDKDSWWSLSRRTGISVLQLRLYNPFLALRPLSSGRLIVYPPAPEPAAVTFAPDSLHYVTRAGDHYLLLAAAFGVVPDRIRAANGLWHVDVVLPGTVLEIPLERDGTQWVDHTREPTEDVGGVAELYGVPVWDVIRDNRLWDQALTEAQVLRVDLARKIPRFSSYKVRRGDTLIGIALEHSIALNSLRKANGFSLGHWRIRIGDVLKIPLN